MNDDLPLTARTLRDARQRSGLSLRAAAKQARTSHSTLSAYEHGALAAQAVVDAASEAFRAVGGAPVDDPAGV